MARADEARLDQRHAGKLFLAEGVAVPIDYKEQSIASQATLVDFGPLEHHASTRLDGVLR